MRHLALHSAAAWWLRRRRHASLSGWSHVVHSSNKHFLQTCDHVSIKWKRELRLVELCFQLLCTVPGNNDTWSGLASGSSGKTTSPILKVTTYTLVCQALSGSMFSETQLINVIPIFQER